MTPSSEPNVGNLSRKIQNDMIEAMKAKDEIRTSTLRMLKAAIMKFEVAGTTKKQASDEEVLKIITKEANQRKDSIEQFKKGGREDLVKKEETELKILQSYLPAQMSDEELKAIIQTVIQESRVTEKGDFGKIMGAVMGRIKGKADGGRVSTLLMEILKPLP